MASSQADIFYLPIGQGEPVIVLHGGPGLDHTYLLPHLQSLANHWKVIFYDQRATGQSGGNPVPNEITMDRFVADLDALRRGLDLAQVHLLGHGWGALLATQYTHAHQDRVKSLVLLNPMPVTGDEFQQCLKRAMTCRAAEDQEQLAQLAISEGVLQGKTDAVNTYFSLWFKSKMTFGDHTAKNSLLVCGLMLDQMGQRYRFNRELESIQIPTLVIAGDHDFVPVQQVQKLASLLPNASLVTLTGVGHFPFAEAPELLFSAVVPFMTSASSAR